AVLEKDTAAVQTDDPDEAENVGDLRLEADEQTEEGDTEEDEQCAGLVGVRRREKQREHLVRGRSPQGSVVRQKAVVRVPGRKSRHAAQEVVEQQTAQVDPREPEAASVECEVSLGNARIPFSKPGGDADARRLHVSVI